MNIKFLSLLLLPVLALASGDVEASGSGETDIFWRVINFAIFFGILYYLVADKIKDFFKDRSEGIASKFSEIEEKKKIAKIEKEEAAQKVKDAEGTATELIENAKKEADIMVTKINETLAHDKTQLEKSHSDRVEIETKKMKKEVVNEVLEDMFTSDSISNKDMLNIIKKKVA